MVKIRWGVLIVGLLVVGGAFAVDNVLFTSQEKAQIETADSACSSGFGRFVSAFSGSTAEKCDRAATGNMILQATPIAYGIGALFVLLGLVIPGARRYSNYGHKQINTAPKTQTVTPKSETSASKSKKEETKYCAYCGESIPKSAKFCSECGKEL